VSSLAGILIGAALNGTDGALCFLAGCTSFVAEYCCVVQSFAEMIHLLLPDFAFVHLRRCPSFRLAVHRHAQPAFHSSLPRAIGHCGAVCFTRIPLVAAAISMMIKMRSSAFVSNACRTGASCRLASRPSPRTRLRSCRRATGVLHTPFIPAPHMRPRVQPSM
jgi:hypothetical protein